MNVFESICKFLRIEFQKQDNRVGKYMIKDNPTSLGLIQESYKKGQLFDVVLMDMRLPKPWDGILLRVEIRKRWREYTIVPFIAQTAFAMKDDKKKIITAGFDEYLSKPISSDDLFTIIAEQLRKRLKHN